MERLASADGDADSSSAGAIFRVARAHRAVLRSDTLEMRSAQHGQLEVAAKYAQRDMRDAKFRRNRVLARLRNLDAASVLAVLMDHLGHPGERPAQLKAPSAAPLAHGVAPDQVARSILAGHGKGLGSLPDSEPRSPTGLEEGDDGSDQPPVAREPDSNPAPAEASAAACDSSLARLRSEHNGVRRVVNDVVAAILAVSFPKWLGVRKRINVLL